MSNYKKNFGSGFVRPFDSSKGSSRDRIMENINESMESYSLSILTKKVFKAVVVSGYILGSFTEAANSPFVNRPVLIDLGDSIPRWKVRFAIHPQLYGTDISEAFTSFYGPSPLIDGIPEAEMQYRVSNMPHAYTDIENSYYSSLHFGSVVNISFRHGHYFITSTFGDSLTTVAGPTSPGPPGPTNNNPVEPATVYDGSVEVLPDGYWRDILHKVIAEGRAENPKRCITGKTYADFCKKVDGGNVGIAHFANRSLNRLLENMIRLPPNGYGPAKVENWFGKKISELKKVFPTCYMPYRDKTTKKRVQKPGTANCAKVYKWYVKGWESFIAEYDKGGDAKKLMIKIQDDTYYQSKVLRAEKILSSNKYPKNMRNMAIILGVINSYGSWGQFSGLDPENALKKYINLKPDGHRTKRANLIYKAYPIKKPVDVKNYKK